MMETCDARNPTRAARAARITVRCLIVWVGAFAWSSGRADLASAERCLRNGITRIVELHEGPRDGLPCEVRYLKPDEGGAVRVMWKASATPGYCATRYDTFLVKLETTLNWSCESRAERAAPSSKDAVSGARSVPTDEPLPDSSSPELSSDMRERVSTSTVPTALSIGTEQLPLEQELGAPIESRSSSESTSVDRTVSLAETLPTPNAGAARPGPAASRVPLVRSRAVTTAVADSPTSFDDPLERLRRRLPSGPWTAVAIDGAEVRERASCPPGGPFLWNTRDPDRPVFELGLAAELPVRLTDVPPDEAPLVLVADTSDDAGRVADVASGSEVTVSRLTLVRETTGPSVRTIEVEIVSARVDGSSTRPERCRYSLGG